MIKNELLYILQTFVALFVIVDPFAVVPVYLSLTERFSPEGIRHTRQKATLVAFGLLALFALTGLSVFKLFGITLPAFQIAGGILLLLLGISQLNNTRARVKPEEKTEGMERDDVSVFPLGTPLLAGPGAISTVVLLSTQAKTPLRMLCLLIALIGAMGAAYMCLKAAPYLYRILGKTGLNLLTRIMGMILTAIAVQFMLNGIRGSLQLMGLFPELGTVPH